MEGKRRSLEEGGRKIEGGEGNGRTEGGQREKRGGGAVNHSGQSFERLWLM